MEFRNELKFMINYADYAVIRMRLGPLMKKDDHAGPNGMYNVRSLYFDDYFNTAYNEKYAGVLERQKYRIRIYNRSDSVIHLERKIKRNSYVHKQSGALTRWQVGEILCGRYDSLLASQEPLLQVFYHECRSKMMRPRAIIEYEREPYLMDAGTVRITFDQHVRVGVDGWDIFDNKMATRELFDPNYLVMEVKYTEFLPTLIQRVLPQKSTEHIAVSKYLLGCDQTLYRRIIDN